MGDVITFITAVFACINSLTFAGIPIVSVFLACAMGRLILTALTRTIDGGASNDKAPK